MFQILVVVNRRDPVKLEVDRNSTTPVSEQLAEQLRFRIATGQISTGQKLPSTRAIADRLGVSYHTVRKAYQVLVDGGLAESRKGFGFVASEYKPTGKHERLEEGAAIVARTVQQLVSLGLDESEMEYLLQEQMSQVAQDTASAKIVFVASFTEFAESGAKRLAEYFGLTIDAVPLSLVDAHLDADYVVAPFPIARTVQERLPRADVIGVRTQLPAAAVELAARLFDHETLLLVVRYSDAIAALTKRLRSDAGFTGQVVAAVVEEGDPRLGALVRQADGVMYTPDAARRIRTHLAAAPANAVIQLEISPPELERIRGLFPG